MFERTTIGEWVILGLSVILALFSTFDNSSKTSGLGMAGIAGYFIGSFFVFLIMLFILYWIITKLYPRSAYWGSVGWILAIVGIGIFVCIILVIVLAFVLGTSLSTPNAPNSIRSSSTGNTIYCNETRSPLEISGALPGTYYSGYIWSDRTTQSYKDELTGTYRDLFFSTVNLTEASNNFNNYLLKYDPDVSKYQSCYWMVYCNNGLFGSTCSEIPLKYRVTYNVGGTVESQDFPVSRPLVYDFNANGLLKLLNK